MANLTPPQSPFIGADGRPAREWQHWFSSLVSGLVTSQVTELLSIMVPDRSAEITELRKRVEALELQLSMRGDASEAPRRPING